jgi:hypothetical protein
MQRRKFIAGMGSLAAAGAAGVGTGAFSAMSAGREANINVVSDADGLIGLVPEDEEGVVYTTDNPGELAIDFSGEGGDAGVNVNSRYIAGSFHHTQVGSGANDVDGTHVFDSNDGENGGTVHSSTMSAWGYAFKVENNATESRDITLTFEADQSEVSGYLGFGLEQPWGQRASIEIEGTQTEDSAEITNVSPGEAVYVSFVVSTINVEDYTMEDLSGTLSVSS